MKKLVLEKPCREAALEWWFCHGNYQFDAEPSTYFLTSFFKAFSSSEDYAKSGYALITGMFVGNESSQACSTVIDPSAQSLFLENSKEFENWAISSHLTNAYMKEILENGPPYPILLKKSSPTLADDNLAITWDDFHLFQSARAFFLSFTSDYGDKCEFELIPQHERLDLTSYGHQHFKRMAYFTYPRMHLTGFVNGRPVKGKAWFDHQYGDDSWFFHKPDGETKKPLSWIWAGINLDDGGDMVFMQHMDANDSESLYNVLHIRDAYGRLDKRENIELKVLRSWESPHTHIHYPLELSLEIPDSEVSLYLQPRADDQEIPFFGIQRAIWEGSGSACGTLHGKPVSGTCRIELNGFGYVCASNDYISSFIKTIDNHIEKFLPKKLDTKWMEEYIGKEHWIHEPEGITKVISQPCWNFLSRNGKHWRPLCAMLFVESTGIQSGPYAQMISLFTELNHSGSLIIDDIEDDSWIRRGAPCLHLQYGLDVAINAGNSLYFLPYVILKNHLHLTESQRLEIYKLIIQVGTRAHIGQGLDIYWSKYLSRDNLTQWMNDDLDQKILQMYAFKTGAGVEAVAELACILSQGSAKQREVFASLGRVFGVAFQIIDDIQNFNSSPGWTKTCGEDVIAGKPTYVIVSALQKLPEQERNRFLDIFCSPQLRKDKSSVQEAVELVKNSGVLEACRSKAEQVIDEEWKQFNKYALHCDAKIMLRMVISALLNYSYDY